MRAEARPKEQRRIADYETRVMLLVAEALDVRDLGVCGHEVRSSIPHVLEEELEKRGPMGPRPLQQAPMRVLSGANMPAALVEIGYLTSADQERSIQSADVQGGLVQGIYDAIVRFRAFLESPPSQ